MLIHTFLLIFIAEMADKTQLMIMALMNRYRVKTIVFGMILGVLSISGISVLAGDLIGDYIPMEVVKLCGALMFLGFGMFNLLQKKEEVASHKKDFHFPILSIAFTFLIAELGDKTQLATVATAADHMDAHMQVFLGASLGLICANIFGIFAGKFIFSHVCESTIKVGSSFIFFFFGSISLFEVFPFTTPILFIYSIILIVIAYYIYQKSLSMK